MKDEIKENDVENYFDALYEINIEEVERRNKLTIKVVKDLILKNRKNNENV